MNVIDEARKRIEENLFFKRCGELKTKEVLLSDTIAAVGHLQQKIVDYATPNLVGRNIINVRPTSESVERFPLDGKSVGYSFGEGGACRLSGDKPRFVVVTMDQFAGSSKQWSKEFIEDLSANALLKIEQGLANALSYDETEAVLGSYNAIADKDLAGGGVLDQNEKVMDWNAIIRLRNAVRSANWKPSVLLLSETQLSQLLLDDKFILSSYLPSKETDIDAGLIRRAMGMNVFSSTLVPNGTAYAIDKLVAGIMLIRRDVTVEDWSDSKNDQYGLKATTRFGLGILRSNAVAKMTGIKTTL
jgi:hypothetical protein